MVQEITKLIYYSVEVIVLVEVELGNNIDFLFLFRRFSWVRLG